MYQLDKKQDKKLTRVFNPLERIVTLLISLYTTLDSQDRDKEKF